MRTLHVLLATSLFFSTFAPTLAKADSLGGFFEKIVSCANESKGKRDKVSTMLRVLSKRIARLDAKARLAERTVRQVKVIVANPVKDPADEARQAASLAAVCRTATKSYRIQIAGLANMRSELAKKKTALQSQLNKIGNGTLACTGIFPKGVTDVISWLTKFSDLFGAAGNSRSRVDYRELVSVPKGCPYLPAYGKRKPSKGSSGGSSSGIDLGDDILSGIKNLF